MLGMEYAEPAWRKKNAMRNPPPGMLARNSETQAPLRMRTCNRSWIAILNPVRVVEPPELVNFAKSSDVANHSEF
jgi:hypothetical protein